MLCRQRYEMVVARTVLYIEPHGKYNQNVGGNAAYGVLSGCSQGGVEPIWNLDEVRHQ